MIETHEEKTRIINEELPAHMHKLRDDLRGVCEIFKIPTAKNPQ